MKSKEEQNSSSISVTCFTNPILRRQMILSGLGIKLGPYFVFSSSATACRARYMLSPVLSYTG